MKFVFLIPLFPLLGFLFNFFAGVRALRRARDEGHGHGHHAHGVHVPAVAPVNLILSLLLVLLLVIVWMTVLPRGGARRH